MTYHLSEVREVGLDRQHYSTVLQDQLGTRTVGLERAEICMSEMFLGHSDVECVGGGFAAGREGFLSFFLSFNVSPLLLLANMNQKTTLLKLL